MDWQSLLATNRVKRHTTSREELEALRGEIARDLKDASLHDLSPDRQFATAYNAVLQVARMAIACVGYRVSARGGHHATSFGALTLAMGPDIADLVSYFDLCRQKRNIVDYEMSDVVSETEAAELLQKADEFRHVVESWIAENYPRFAATRQA